jgi:N-acetylglutamate synthase-like GNAT family acetyltransferase
MVINITNLSPEFEEQFLKCLEDWSADMQESGNQRRLWFEDMKSKGLLVKIALDEQNRITGFIQAVPVIHSIIEGKSGYFINCIWVHGHKQGIGDMRKKGYGTALLNALEADLKSQGVSGVSAWGLILPFWMKASWFKKHGYLRIDREGMAALMWKAFSTDSDCPRWRKIKKQPIPGTDKLNISVFCHGWCSAMNISYERIKRIAEEFHPYIHFEEYNTRDRRILEEWGISDAIYLDDKTVNTGPPPSYEALRKRVIKMLKKKKLMR